MTTKEFDTRNIRWNRIDGFDHIEYHVCDVDEANRTVDLLFKFAANQIVLHRHHAAYRTLVLQGELRIYRANGEVKEIRPVGSYGSRRPAASRIPKGAARTSSCSSAIAMSTASFTRFWTTI